MLCTIALVLFVIQNPFATPFNEVSALSIGGVNVYNTSLALTRTNYEQTIEKSDSEVNNERMSLPNIFKVIINGAANYKYERKNESIITEGLVNSEENYHFFPALMPEDVRYARASCSADFPQAVLNWTSQDFRNNTEANQTYCYVKCFLRRLGLIRLDTLGWDLKRMARIYLNLGGESTFPTNCFDSLNETKEMSGNCEPHYRVWINVYRDCRLGFNYFFYHDVQPKELPFNKTLPPSREIGVNPMQFCAELLPQNITVTKSPIYILCIYMQLHYFDGYGRLDESEIIRSFEESERLTASNESRIKACVHLANGFFINGRKGQEMANQLNTCLTKNLPVDFPYVLQYWNQVMSEY